MMDAASSHLATNSSHFCEMCNPGYPFRRPVPLGRVHQTSPSLYPAVQNSLGSFVKSDSQAPWPAFLIRLEPSSQVLPVLTFLRPYLENSGFTFKCGLRAEAEQGEQICENEPCAACDKRLTRERERVGLDPYFILFSQRQRCFLCSPELEFFSKV